MHLKNIIRSLILLAALAASTLGIGLCPGSSCGMAQAAILTVSSSRDSGTGSLRQALQTAAQMPGSTIQFHLPRADAGFDAASGTWVFKPATLLPVLSARSTVIDGSSQAAFGGNTNRSGPEIVLDGARLPASADFPDVPDPETIHGLKVTGARCTIRDLCIIGWSDYGIFLSGTGAVANRVQGCFIGLDATGKTRALNRIGVFVQEASETLIGGNTAGARNVIVSGENGGVLLSNANNNKVRGCFIGVDAQAKVGLGAGSGIIINSGRDNLIGGAGLREGNVLSGNEGAGLSIRGESSGNRVLGNRIGTPADSDSALGNSEAGIALFAFDFDFTRGANRNVIGGVGSGEGNRIAFNGSDGVLLSISDGGEGVGNAIRGNAIFSNRGLGIDLNSEFDSFGGVTPNDAGDVDRGPNNGQNFPVIRSVRALNGTTSIEGRLQSLPRTRFLIDVYSNTRPDSSFFGDARTYLGTTEVTTDANGEGNWSLQLSNTFPGGFYTATATGNSGAALGDTSEFSQVQVEGEETPSSVVTTTRDLELNEGKTSLREAINFANAHPGTTISFRLPRNDPGFFNGVWGITPLGQLPAITARGTLLDASTQTAFGGNTNLRGPEVSLNAVLNIPDDDFSVPNFIQLELKAADCLVRGLDFSGFPKQILLAITDAASSGNRVEGCVFSSSDIGININGAPSNTLGGVTPGARCVFLGCESMAINIAGASASDNRVLGCLMGTTPEGDLVPNRIGLFTSGPRTVIGGPGAARNLFAANFAADILVDSGASASSVLNNLIGLDMQGNLAAGAQDADGILISSGRSLVAGNTIGGRRRGVAFDSFSFEVPVTGNRIHNNFIGTDATGRDLGNEVGIDIGTAGNVIGGAGLEKSNTVRFNGSGISVRAGRNLVQGNRISDNDGSGVIVGGDAFNGGAQGNAIRANTIFNNGGLGIDLLGEQFNNTSGPTPNDPRDEDAGANALQNFPILTGAQASAQAGSSGATIQGRLNSSPNSTFSIDFYSNPALDDSGFDEGEVFLGTRRVTTDANGNVSFSFEALNLVPTRVVSSTATNVATGDTSEFSRAVPINTPANAQANPVARSQSSGLSQARAEAGSTQVSLQFERALAAEAEDAERFTVSVNGQTIAVIGAKLSGSRVVLQLADELQVGDHVTVAWRGGQATGHPAIEGSITLTVTAKP